ncbi:chromobox protein homolog 5-like [Bradysia coprophila]|uniref:chromobox protein homolog 5-like n=1 Tax=Bradysia coprophila TaxID=38358 RepID=UPI00187DC3EC|nr:chromobox protein homolog 5-like [Bradysia coprophila]
MARTFDRKAQESFRELEDERCCTLYADDPNVFAVDEIVDIRAVTTEIEYLVKWTGYTAVWNEWVSERNVTSDLKREFSRANKEKVMKWMKRVRALEERRKNIKIETGATTTIKKEFEEEKPNESQLSLWTAVKKEDNEREVTPTSATLSDQSIIGNNIPVSVQLKTEFE